MTSDTREYHKQYYLDHKDTLLPKIREYGKNKYDTNTEYKLLKRYQSRIDNHFGASTYKAEDLLSCSKEFFKLWIDFNLENNKDYSDIHLAHVRPVTTFNKNPLIAFHWTNVYPLTREQNLRQSDNRDTELEKHQQRQVIKYLQTIKLE